MLSDSTDLDVRDGAINILPKLKTKSRHDVNGGSATGAFLVEQLAGSQSQLPILSLVDLATEELHTAAEKDSMLTSLLPSESAWSAALEPHLNSKPSSTLSITSPLQGAVYSVRAGSTDIQSVSHDSEGFSQAFRMTLYVVRLLTSFKTGIKELPTSSLLISHLAIALQLINEKLTLESANTIWIEGTGEVVDEAADVLSHGNSILRAWTVAVTTPFLGAVQLHREKLLSDHPSAYYHALALCNVSAYLTDHDGLKQIFPDLEADVKALHRSENLLKSATLANCAREHIISSAAGRRTLNELLSAATQVKWSDRTEDLLQPIVLLNLFAQRRL